MDVSAATVHVLMISDGEVKVSRARAVALTALVLAVACETTPPDQRDDLKRLIESPLLVSSAEEFAESFVYDGENFGAAYIQDDRSNANVGLARFSADGLPVGAPTVIGPSLFHTPRVGHNGSEYLVAFKASTTTLHGIVVQRVSNAGALVGDAVELDLSSAASQNLLGDVIGGGGHWLVTLYEVTGTGSRLVARIVHADGSIGPTLVVADPGMQAAGAFDAQHSSFVIVYQATKWMPGQPVKLLARTVSLDGVMGAPTLIAELANEMAPGLAMGSQGTLSLVAWSERTSLDDWLVRSQLISRHSTSEHRPTGAPVNVSDGLGGDAVTSVTPRGDHFVVSWRSSLYAHSFTEILVRKVSSAGQPIGGETMIVPRPGVFQSAVDAFIRATTHEAGAALVALIMRSSSTSSDVFVARIPDALVAP